MQRFEYKAETVRSSLMGDKMDSGDVEKLPSDEVPREGWASEPDRHDGQGADRSGRDRRPARRCSSGRSAASSEIRLLAAAPGGVASFGRGPSIESAALRRSANDASRSARASLRATFSCSLIVASLKSLSRMLARTSRSAAALSRLLARLSRRMSHVSTIPRVVEPTLPLGRGRLHTRQCASTRRPRRLPPACSLRCSRYSASRGTSARKPESLAEVTPIVQLVIGCLALGNAECGAARKGACRTGETSSSARWLARARESVRRMTPLAVQGREPPIPRSRQWPPPARAGPRTISRYVGTPVLQDTVGLSS